MADGSNAPAKTFRWEDPLDLDGRLTDDETMIRDAARAYARDRLLPRIVAAFRDETFDRAIMTEMGEMGFLGAMLPEQYGGSCHRGCTGDCPVRQDRSRTRRPR